MDRKSLRFLNALNPTLLPSIAPSRQVLALWSRPVLPKFGAPRLSGAVFLTQVLLLMVDGNGILHPRGFGLASHLGVLADIPTIGIGKNLHHVDGLTNLEVRHVVSESNLQAGGAMPLIGSTGQVWGMAFRSHDGCQKPVFISVGHLISLDTAVEVVRRCCLHRVPEPVLQADLRSREHLRKHPLPGSQPT